MNTEQRNSANNTVPLHICQLLIDFTLGPDKLTISSSDLSSFSTLKVAKNEITLFVNSATDNVANPQVKLTREPADRLLPEEIGAPAALVIVSVG